MGGVLLGERVGQIPKRVHNSTFGGNPLACAAALATIDVLESENLSQRSAELGARLMAGLKAIESPLIREVRGLGLMVGVELKTKSGKYLAALAEKGVLALPAGGNVIRYLPPLVISEEDIDVVIAATIAVLTA
jgi:acetylornithine/LysW-gamma-L-lysine aminotransferase